MRRRPCSRWRILSVTAGCALLVGFPIPDTPAQDPIVEITRFVPPQIVLDRGDSAEATVRLINMSGERRSFWVGLSYSSNPADSTIEPVWYDVPPQSTDPVADGEPAEVTFKHPIPPWLPPGTYTAHTAVWHDYDREKNQMLPFEQPFARETASSFELLFFSQIGSIPEQISWAASQFTSLLAEEQKVWAEYDNGKKTLLYVTWPSAVSAVGNVFGIPIGVDVRSPVVLIDLADLFLLTPEGNAGTVTVWVDAVSGFDSDASFKDGFGMGFTVHEFEDDLHPDVREEVYYDSSFLAAPIDDVSWHDVLIDSVLTTVPVLGFTRTFDSEISASQTRASLERREVGRNELYKAFDLEWENLLGVGDFKEMVMLLVDGFVDFDEDVKGTDDDGYWPPDTPSNQSPRDGETDVSLNPVLKASAFTSRNADDALGQAHWLLDDDPLFRSPELGSREVVRGTSDWETNSEEVTVPGGVLHPGTEYYWRVLYEGSRLPGGGTEGVLSEWSQATSFVTIGDSGPTNTPTNTPTVTPTPTATPTHTPTGPTPTLLDSPGLFVSSGIAYPGGKATIVIDLTTERPATSVCFDVVYNEENVSSVQCVLADRLTDDFTLGFSFPSFPCSWSPSSPDCEDPAGTERMRVSVVDRDPPLPLDSFNSGRVFTCTFEFAKSAMGNEIVSMQLDRLEVADNNGHVICEESGCAREVGEIRVGCACDCDGDGSVSISDLILAVAIALGAKDEAECDVADVSPPDGAVNIDEVMLGVSAAFAGCS